MEEYKIIIYPSPYTTLNPKDLPGKKYSIYPIRIFNRIIGVFVKIGQTQFHPIKNGVMIIYPCGTKRFIMNSWYSDIDTDNL